MAFAMASLSHRNYRILVSLSIFSLLTISPNAQSQNKLSPDFYAKSCPNLQSIVRSAMTEAVRNETRMAASLLRLFFHDCFVNGCDGSILLDDTENFTGEKNALPNINSARGFDVVDTIKARVEAACTATVSCADILALATRDGIALLGGPSWAVRLGRRDSRTASQDAANSNLPGPSADLSTLISMFASNGLNARDLTALSGGGHTIGFSRCFFFRDRIYNDSNIDPDFAADRRTTCPPSGDDDNLAPLDATPIRFDVRYFSDLLAGRGLFHSDQELFNGGSQDELVRIYSNDPRAFNRDFVNAMIKMGNLGPPEGEATEIRINCREVN